MNVLKGLYKVCTCIIIGPFYAVSEDISSYKHIVNQLYNYDKKRIQTKKEYMLRNLINTYFKELV